MLEEHFFYPLVDKLLHHDGHVHAAAPDCVARGVRPFSQQATGDLSLQIFQQRRIAAVVLREREKLCRRPSACHEQQLRLCCATSKLCPRTSSLDDAFDVLPTSSPSQHNRVPGKRYAPAFHRLRRRKKTTRKRKQSREGRKPACQLARRRAGLLWGVWRISSCLANSSGVPYQPTTNAPSQAVAGGSYLKFCDGRTPELSPPLLSKARSICRRGGHALELKPILLTTQCTRWQ